MSWWRVAVLVVAILAVGWLRMTQRPRVGPQPPSDLEVAEAWLQCIDCRGSFLKRLYEMPAQNRDTVTRFLRSALLAGPDSMRVRRHTQDVLKTWRADSIYRARRRLPARPDTQFAHLLARYQTGFEVMWRSRGATALGVIRDSLALAALDSALQLPLTDKGDSIIRRMVERAKADTGRVVLTGAPPGTASTAGIGRVSGRVADVQGTPLANADIGLRRPHAIRAMTGPNGEYTLTGVPAGTHLLQARMIGHRRDSASITVTAGQTTNQDFTLRR